MSTYKPLRTFTNAEVLDIAIPARGAGKRWLQIDTQTSKQTETMKKHDSFKYKLNITTPTGAVRFIRETNPIKTASKCTRGGKNDDEKKEEKKSDSKTVNFKFQTRFILQNPKDAEADAKIRDLAISEMRVRFPGLPADQLEVKVADRIKALNVEFEQNMVEWCIHEEIMAIITDIKVQVGLLNFIKTDGSRICSNVQTHRKINLQDENEKKMLMSGNAPGGLIPLENPIVRYNITGSIEKNELWCDIMDLTKVAGNRVQKATVAGSPVGIATVEEYLTYGSIFYQRVEYQINQGAKALECVAYTKKLFVRRAAQLKGDKAAAVNADMAKNAMDDDDFQDYVEEPISVPSVPVLPNGADAQAEAFQDC